MGIFSQLSSSIGAAISGAIEKKRVENELATQQLRNLQKNEYKQQVYNTFQGDYFDFASALKNCLQNNTRCGVSSPKRIEDVFVPAQTDRISGNLLPDGTYSNIDFHFEANREPTNMNVHTISDGTYEYVSPEEVKRQLQSELPKYTDGFTYTGISVVEIPGDKLKITVHGVDRTLM